MSQADPIALPDELKLTVVKGLVKLENRHFVIYREDINADNAQNG